jgi:hypothetical protein
MSSNRKRAAAAGGTLPVVPDVRILLVSAAARAEKPRQAAAYRGAVRPVNPMFSRTPVVAASYPVALEKGDSHLLCEAPYGPYRQKVAVTFFLSRILRKVP